MSTFALSTIDMFDDTRPLAVPVNCAVLAATSRSMAAAGSPLIVAFSVGLGPTRVASSGIAEANRSMPALIRARRAPLCLCIEVSVEARLPGEGRTSQGAQRGHIEFVHVQDRRSARLLGELNIGVARDLHRAGIQPQLAHDRVLRGRLVPAVDAQPRRFLEQRLQALRRLNDVVHDELGLRVERRYLPVGRLSRLHLRPQRRLTGAQRSARRILDEHIELDVGHGKRARQQNVRGRGLVTDAGKERPPDTRRTQRQRHLAVEAFFGGHVDAFAPQAARRGRHAEAVQGDPLGEDIRRRRDGQPSRRQGRQVRRQQTLYLGAAVEDDAKRSPSRSALHPHRWRRGCRRSPSSLPRQSRSGPSPFASRRSGGDPGNPSRPATSPPSGLVRLDIDLQVFGRQHRSRPSKTGASERRRAYARPRRAANSPRRVADSEARAVRRAGWPRIASPSRSSPDSEAAERDVHAAGSAAPSVPPPRVGAGSAAGRRCTSIVPISND